PMQWPLAVGMVSNWTTGSVMALSKRTAGCEERESFAKGPKETAKDVVVFFETLASCSPHC
ncbi:MAG: hypothetical protein ABIW85_08000, partial [Variovorax sp.]